MNLSDLLPVLLIEADFTQVPAWKIECWRRFFANFRAVTAQLRSKRVACTDVLPDGASVPPISST